MWKLSNVTPNFKKDEKRLLPDIFVSQFQLLVCDWKDGSALEFFAASN